MLEKFNSGKHLYGRGWLGLIPLFGGVVGLGLIFLGIYKYKDRKLMIIGLAGLAFTVFVYGSMIYYFQFSEQHRKDFSGFSQPYMNTLVKSVEFYKIENGVYPDSLEQIAATDKTVIITDPILSGKPIVNKRMFYYKKFGEKYNLFSAGIDMIPYTKDDIFPSTRFFDSNKTGLIRPL
jgi:hypothetical protein